MIASTECTMMRSGLHVGLLVFLFFLSWTPGTFEKENELLYPYGEGVSDEEVWEPRDGSTSTTTQLRQPIRFFGEHFDSLHISIHGLVSFLRPLNGFLNMELPVGDPGIAAFYTKVDLSQTGSIYYRQSSDEDLLNIANNKIESLYSNLPEKFIASSIVYVTWYKVSPEPDSNKVTIYHLVHYNSLKVNTFQLAIYTDGHETFVELLYPENGIQWVQGKGQVGETVIRAQAGITTPNGKMFPLSGSGTNKINSIDRLSNTNVPGQFIFRVGDVNDEVSAAEGPHVVRESVTEKPTSCSEGAERCDINADCFDFDKGFCCQCRPSFYGDGLACISTKVPRRMSGKLNISVNDVQAQNLDFQGYIVLSDGRAFSAVDQLPRQIGPEMQLLSALGGFLGWMFAIPVGGAKNGFQLTGGKAKQIAEIVFDQYHKVRLIQKFKGFDALDVLKVEGVITGKIPKLGILNQDQSQILPKYTEDYTRIGPGIYRSNAKHEIRTTTGRQEISIDQTITFEEHCTQDVENMGPLRLSAHGIYISYKPDESVFRFASYNNVTKASENADPCIEGRHHCIANSSCVADGDSFKCVCDDGFTNVHNDVESSEISDGCVDVNECTDGTANCDRERAICINEIGTYLCRCKSGLKGDGIICENPPEVDISNGYCGDVLNISTCTCNHGYEKSSDEYSFHCQDVDECAYPGICHREAECNNYPGGFSCACRFGYVGDGLSNCEYHESCGRIRCPETTVCVENGDKVSCECAPGYSGSPPLCLPESESEPSYPKPSEPVYIDKCDSDADCPENSKCTWNYTLPGYGCNCIDGHYDYGSGCELKKTFNISRGPLFSKTCLDGTCWCPPGYFDNGDFCMWDGKTDGQEENGNGVPEDSECDKCHPSARCIYNSSIGKRMCICNEGLEGNGYQCGTPDADICHEFASCIYDDSIGKDVCICTDGYVGDGSVCYPDEICGQPCADNEMCAFNGLKGIHECVCFEGYYKDHEGQCQVNRDCGDCGPDEDCAFVRDRFECVCREGHVRQNGICVESYCEEDCSPNGDCVYNDTSELFECFCLAGFEKSYNGRCERSSIDVCERCHSKATCVRRRGQSDCQCDDGYDGDGFDCKEIVQGCEILKNCSPYGDCLYNAEERGYRCRCREGYKGDGVICEEIITCQQRPDFCSPDATCLYLQGKFTCKCIDGFFGDGSVCKKAKDQDEEFLIVNKGKYVFKVPFDPSDDNRGSPINKGSQPAIGIAIDCVEGRVYWSDGPTIKRAKYDGSEAETFVTGVVRPEGMTIDWIARTLYWTDAGKKMISSINLETLEKNDLISSDLNNPRGIVVHPWMRKLFWTDWDRNSPKLEMANIDGSQREKLVQSPNIILPNSLAIDWRTNEICWADAGTKTIECINDKRSIGIVKVTIPNSFPFGLAITDDAYYWTEWNKLKIEKTLKGSNETTQIKMTLGGNDKLYGLVAVSSCPKY